MSWKEELESWARSNNLELPKDKYPLILCEGPDAAGKSFVIDILMEIINHCFLLHTSAPTKGNSKNYYKNLLNKSIELFEVLNQPLIADRFHIGEAVYGSIFRNYNLKYSYMEDELLRLGAKQIFITAKEEVLVERLQKRGDWYIKTDDINPILTRYKEELAKTKIPTYTLDTTNNLTPKDIEKLLKFIYE